MKQTEGVCTEEVWPAGWANIAPAGTKVEVECDNIDQVRAALYAGATSSCSTT